MRAVNFVVYFTILRIVLQVRYIRKTQMSKQQKQPYKEHPSISDRDWRLRAISTVAEDFRSPNTNILYPTGTPLELAGFIRYEKKVVGIPVPDASALYLSIAKRLGQAGASVISTQLVKPLAPEEQKSKIISKEDESDFFDALENLIACVIFSYTAIEAFANGIIPDEYQYTVERSDKRCTETYTKNQIERHISLTTKLDAILPQICAVKSPKGTKIWDEYIWLSDMRSRFVHLKSTDWIQSGPEKADQFIWTSLLSKKVITSPKIAFSIIQHYTSKETPRWVHKYSDNS